MTSNKRQHSFVGVTMGRECTGKARIEPTDRINPPDEGPRHMAPYRGGASCLYCKAGIDAGVMSWGQVNPVQQGSYAPSLTGLQHRAEGVPQAAIPHPKRQVEREVPCAKPRPTLYLDLETLWILTVLSVPVGVSNQRYWSMIGYKCRQLSSNEGYSV